jgi:uncharacterized DUF497 family protein
MSDLSFEWDRRKAETNLQKHGVSFDEAKSVFYDEDARVITDPDHSETEDRFIIIGRSRILRVLVIAHCYRHDDSIIRLISARKASKTEEKQYRRNK